MGQGGKVDSGGQGWGELADITCLSFSCDPHSPERQMTEPFSSLQTFQRCLVQREAGYLKLLPKKGASALGNGGARKSHR